MRKWWSPPVGSLIYDYPLRADYLAQLVLPRDLTEHEAAKLCGFIKTLAMPANEHGALKGG